MQERIKIGALGNRGDECPFVPVVMEESGIAQGELMNKCEQDRKKSASLGFGKQSDAAKMNDGTCPGFPVIHSARQTDEPAGFSDQHQPIGIIKRAQLEMGSHMLQAFRAVPLARGRGYVQDLFLNLAK